MLLLERERGYVVAKSRVPVQISARVSPEHKVKIAALAADMGLKDSDVIRQMIEFAMPEFESRAERYKQARREGVPTQEEIEEAANEIAGEVTNGEAVTLTLDELRGVQGRALARILAALWPDSPPTGMPPFVPPSETPRSEQQRRRK